MRTGDSALHLWAKVEENGTDMSRDNQTIAEPRPRPSIADIAAHTGLAQSTVSRAINGRPRVAEQTRARVMAALDELGYVPSSVATSLRTGRTRLLGLMIGETRDPTALSFMQGALDTAAGAQYGVVVYMTRDPADHAGIYSQVLGRGWVDGALLLWPHKADEAFARRLQESGLPMVMIEPEVEMHGVPAVYPDARSDGYRSVQYLLGLGHRRIGTCTAIATWGLAGGHLDGYRAALAEAGEPFDPQLVLTADYSYEGGYRMAAQLLQLPEPPTAICFYSDMAAMGAIAAARDRGLQVPQDLSVMGYDDTEMAQWIKPSLTTLHHRRLGLAQAACRLLLALLEGAEQPGGPLLVTADIAVRQSTGRTR
jgi:LacI family transcriptional regulator